MSTFIQQYINDGKDHKDYFILNPNFLTQKLNNEH